MLARKSTNACETEIPTLQMAHLLIRECFTVRYQHIVRVIDPAIAQNWANKMDQIARDEWARTMTIKPMTQYHRDQKYTSLLS